MFPILYSRTIWGAFIFSFCIVFTLSNTKPLDVSKRGKYGRLLAQLHGSLTPAHACGCGAQCFVGVQRASIFNLPVCRCPQAATPALRPGMDRSLLGGHGAPAVWLDTEQNVSVALYCTVGLPPGFLFQRAGASLPDHQGKERE